MRTSLYSELKKQEAKQRREVMRRRGSRSARAYQRQVALVGAGSRWQITNLRQVSAAMAKWA